MMCQWRSAGYVFEYRPPYGMTDAISYFIFSPSSVMRSLNDADYRRFVEMARIDLGLALPIMITIDEMDKMKTLKDAEGFLNDNKAIFSIPNCIYLVSISESAMSNFERRGLSFRDTFDSSFHEVVRVKYFNIEESIRLLERRVIGLPRPFQGLCHCLSGGLARDLVRVARKLSFEASGQNLANVKERLIREELNGKIDAVQTIIRDFTVEPHLRRFVSMLRIIGTEALGVAQQITSNLWEACVSKSQEVDVFNSTTDKNNNAEAKKQVATICTLGRELSSYIYYLDSVGKLFENEPNNSMFAINGPVDQLAQARQALEVNPWIAWERISQFRDKNGQAKWTIPRTTITGE